MDQIADLSPLQRQLLEASDFFTGTRALFKKLSAEEESDKFGFDGSQLCSEIKDVLTLLELEGIQTEGLKRVLNLAEEDPSIIPWIVDHWDEFVNLNTEDITSAGESLVLDSNLNPDKILTKDKENTGFRKDSYSYVDGSWKNNFAEASEKRVAHKGIRIQDIQKCTYPQEVEKELEKTRRAYLEDKEILTAWSKERKEEDRNLYLSSLHKQGYDFETIRRKMWFVFDREREEKIVKISSRPLKSNWVEHYDPLTKKVSEEGYYSEEEIAERIIKGLSDPRECISERSFSDSAFWDLERSRVFCGLNQTKAQWTSVYNYLWKRMGQTLVWRINGIKRYNDGIVLADILRKYQFRIDMKDIGKILLKKASQVQSEKGRTLIRILLSSCQYRLETKVAREITQELGRKRF